MRQSTPLTAALAALFLSACGPGEVVVTIETQAQDPLTGDMVTRAIPNQQVFILPYDRDVVFDSLAAAAPTPEPPIPADLLEAQAVISAAQQEWRDLENQWNVLRDTLQTLNRELEQFSPASAQYRLLHADFLALEARLNQVESRKDGAFENFTGLQDAVRAREQEVRAERERWAEDAFAEVGLIFRERLRASGLDTAVDTTDTAGVARFSVKPGQYWIHARSDELFTELYWNVPVTVERGEPLQINLNRSNAQERPRL